MANIQDYIIERSPFFEGCSDDRLDIRGFPNGFYYPNSNITIDTFVAGGGLTVSVPTEEELYEATEGRLRIQIGDYLDNIENYRKMFLLALAYNPTINWLFEYSIDVLEAV